VTATFDAGGVIDITTRDATAATTGPTEPTDPVSDQRTTASG
jgi:hypothetical protein